MSGNPLENEATGDSTEPLFHLTIELSNKGENCGEDAPPLFLASENKQVYVVGVFDGMGGSGSTIYTNKECGIKHTGAYLASRTVKDTVKYFFQERIDKENPQINSSDIGLLKQKIIESLKAKLEQHSHEPTRIKSSMVQVLPTTMAVGLFSRHLDTEKISVFWAGDSRVYLLTNKKGNLQLTKDDLCYGNDPYQNISNDSPISNKIHLDGNFTINFQSWSFKNSACPALFLAATDGCFGYLKTPMHFEALLLDTLQYSNSIQEWQTRLTDRLRLVAGDDCTMSLVCLVKEVFDFFAFKAEFSARQSHLSSTYISPIDTLGDIATKCNETSHLADDALKDSCKNLWNRYKETNYDFFNTTQ